MQLADKQLNYALLKEQQSRSENEKSAILRKLK